MSRPELFRIDRVPVYQNKMYASHEEARTCPVGDIVLVQDVRTGLVFNEAYDPALLRYDESYQNEQACSPSFQRHLAAVLDIFAKHFEGRRILEVGCGKGYFLELLRMRGYEAIGIDPAYEGDAPYVIRGNFEETSGVTGEVVILRHVLEHIPQPYDFLKAVAKTNLGRGLIYIEVPCLEWILRRRAWFDIFYEHVNYFRASDFLRMFGTVHEIGYLFGDQYLYAIADLGSLRESCRISGEPQVDFPGDFISGISQCVAGAQSHKHHVIWGAAAKGTMFAYHMKREGAGLDFAIDINPGKQGRFLAASALQVLAPHEALPKMSSGDVVYVMNSNYLQEIIALGGSRFTYLPVDIER